MQDIVARATEPLKNHILKVNVIVLNALKKAVVPKHRLIYTAIKPHLIIAFTFRKHFKAVFEAVPLQ